jgi:hypothetical protein
MSDDFMQSAITHSAALIGGGGLSSVVVRLLFGSFAEKLDGVEKRLDKMESALEQREARTDKKHDELVAMIADVRKEAAAAHTRLDIYVPKSRRR